MPRIKPKIFTNRCRATVLAGISEDVGIQVTRAVVSCVNDAVRGRVVEHTVQERVSVEDHHLGISLPVAELECGSLEREGRIPPADLGGVWAGVGFADVAGRAIQGREVHEEKVAIAGVVKAGHRAVKQRRDDVTIVDWEGRVT